MTNHPNRSRKRHGTISHYLALTPSPSPASVYFYVSVSKSGAFGWTPRLGEAVRFATEDDAYEALLSMLDTCSREMVNASRVIKVGESK